MEVLSLVRWAILALGVERFFMLQAEHLRLLALRVTQMVLVEFQLVNI
jgi:hypothetical protein